MFVVPSTWTDNNKVCDEFTTEAPKNVDIYFTDSVDSSVLKAQHSRGCAEKGDIIYISKDWLTTNIQESKFLIMTRQHNRMEDTFERTENPLKTYIVNRVL